MKVFLAAGLCVVAFTVVIAGILVLTMTERHTGAGSFLDRAFEAVSTFNTVGLSTGITAKLTVGGKLTLVLLMYLGRVGTLTVAAALARTHPEEGRFRYAYEDVTVG